MANSVQYHPVMDTPSSLAAMTQHAQTLLQLAVQLGFTHIVIIRDPEPDDTAEIIFRVALPQEGEPADEPQPTHH